MVRVYAERSRGIIDGASIACLAALYFAAHSFIPSCFDDGTDYAQLMGMSIFSASYWLHATTMYRGFSVPMIYSLFGGYDWYSSHAVVLFQTVVAFLSWIVFAKTLSGVITGRRTRWLFFMLLASGMFSRGYLAFDDRFLSDSLALSMMLLWISLIVRPFALIEFVRSRGGRSWLWVFLILVYVVTAIVASARDANILLIVCCTPILFLYLPDRRLAAFMTMAILFACGVEWIYSASRSYVTMGDIVSGVVLPDQGRTDYFAAHGLPASIVSLRASLPPTIKDRTPRQIIADRRVVMRDLGEVRRVVLARAADYVRTRTRAIYVSWLMRHPRYVIGNIVESWRVMFDQKYEGDFFAYIEEGPLFELSKSFSMLDWLDVRLLVAVAIALSLATIRQSWSDALMRTGFILAVAGFANSVIAFHGDLWELSEMSRHAWIGSTFLRLGAGVICFRAVTLLWAVYAERSRGIRDGAATHSARTAHVGSSSTSLGTS